VTSADDPPLVLTVQELAKLLRVHEKTVYQHLTDGKIPGVVKVGRAVRFNREAVLAWIASGDQRARASGRTR
jgi:excisionase family DNA binding protein